MEMPTKPKEDMTPHIQQPSNFNNAPRILPEDFPARKEAGIYALLAVLFGNFGTHYFYIGRVKDGLDRFKSLIIFILIGIIPVVGWIVLAVALIIMFFSNWGDAKDAMNGKTTDVWRRPLV